MASSRISDRVGATVTTTDAATTTTLLSYTLPTGAVVTAILTVGAKTSTPAGASRTMAATFKNVGGTVSQIGATLTNLSVGDVALATITAVFDVTGATFRVRVNGVAATTIDWFCDGDIQVN